MLRVSCERPGLHGESMYASHIVSVRVLFTILWNAWKAVNSICTDSNRDGGRCSEFVETVLPI